MKYLVTVLLALCLLSGCVSNRPLTNERLAMAVRITIRHAVADSSRATEKAENIRAVVTRLQAIATTETNVSGLKAEVIRYLDTLELTDLQRNDALDVLDYFSAVIEAQVGEETFDNIRLVKVQEFLMLILAAIPLETGMTAYWISPITSGGRSAQ